MMEIKKIISVLSICTLLLSGCGSQTAKSDKKTPAKEDMIINASGSGDLMEWIHSTKDYVTNSDLIVYGEISDFEMQVSETSGFIHTLETVHIIETLYGDVKAGSNVLINDFGGYALIKDIINAFETEEERRGYREAAFGYLTDEELDTKYLSEVPEGYYYPEIGARGVYCLKLIVGTDDMYRIVGAWQGKFREIEEGVLAKPNTSSSLSDPEESLSNGTITYEELKAKILNASKQ